MDLSRGPGSPDGNPLVTFFVSVCIGSRASGRSTAVGALHDGSVALQDGRTQDHSVVVHVLVRLIGEKRRARPQRSARDVSPGLASRVSSRLRWSSCGAEIGTRTRSISRAPAPTKMGKTCGMYGT